MSSEYDEKSREETVLRSAIAATPVLVFAKTLKQRFPESEWYVVGGAVRDILLGRGMPSDIDLVVRNIPMEKLASALATLGRVDLVGRTFGVLKFVPEGFDGTAIDIALPRTEIAGGSGAYRDVNVHADEELPIGDDLSRRDFTINALAWNMFEDVLINPRGGIADLEARLIRAVGDPAERFAEDLSRMLRCIRFACQLDFEVEERTWTAVETASPRINETVRDVASGEDVRLVPYETVAKEFVKALDADAPRALDMLESSGLLFRMLPEIRDMAGTAQSPNYHSEGDVWTHTKLAVAQLHGPTFAKWFPGHTPDVQTTLSVLFHDIGKPATRAEKDGHITFYGHDAKGAQITEVIIDRMRLTSVNGYKIDGNRITWAVRLHLLPNMIDLESVRRTTLYKHFFSDSAWGRRLLHLAFADASASIPEGSRPDLSNLRTLLEQLEEMRSVMSGESELPRLLSGDEVMEITGLSPGPNIGRLLDSLKEAQLDGGVRTAEDAERFIMRLHE